MIDMKLIELSSHNHPEDEPIFRIVDLIIRTYLQKLPGVLQAELPRNPTDKVMDD